MQDFLEIYCDGACRGNPGPGGWGAILIFGDNIKNISGFELQTTNNRMELTAAIEALQKIKKSIIIKIYTDSTYLIKGITEWLKIWKLSNWKGGKIKNIDLWKKLDSITAKFNIEWHWVKGHSGNKYNEIADQLARKQIENYLKKHHDTIINK